MEIPRHTCVSGGRWSHGSYISVQTNDKTKKNKSCMRKCSRSHGPLKRLCSGMTGAASESR